VPSNFTFYSSLLMAPKWSTGRRMKIKSDLRVGFKMEEWQTVTVGLICSPYTNYEFAKKKRSLHEITRARGYVCVGVCLHSYVRMMYLIMCILMYLFVYLCTMYAYSKYNKIFVESPVHISSNVSANTTCACVRACVYTWALTRSPRITH
jgi:hypothetical protein